MMVNDAQQKTIDHLCDYFGRKWTQIDIYGREMDEFGEVRDDEHQRCIITDGCGGLKQISKDGTWANLIPMNPIPEDAPMPMFPDTERNGVIGFMCKIDFECELGGASGGNIVYPSAQAALCQVSCGVVEVEVIGRKIIIEESDEGDVSITDVMKTLNQYDEGECDE